MLRVAKETLCFILRILRLSICAAAMHLQEVGGLDFYNELSIDWLCANTIMSCHLLMGGRGFGDAVCHVTT